MDEAESTAGDDDPPVADEPATVEVLQERLADVEAERAALQARVEHELDASREVFEAHAAAEGRVAELEGILTGTEAVRARAESERDALEARLPIELAAAQQAHDEAMAATEHRLGALAELLERQTQEREAERAEQDAVHARLAERIAELELRLKEELAQAAKHAESLVEQARAAREELKPRAARKLAEVQAELDAEREARTTVEARHAELAEEHQALEQARAQEVAAAQTRIAELEPALEEARTGWEHSWGELDALREQLTKAEAALVARDRELTLERDTALRRVAELERSLSETEDGNEVVERALQSVSADRDRIETARRVLEARMTARDEAERAFLAERELERRTARSHRLQLTRVERRMTEIASGLGVALRRLDAPGVPKPEASDDSRAPSSGPRAPARARRGTETQPRQPATSRPQPPAAVPARGSQSGPPAADRTMLSGFERAAKMFPKRPALEVAGETIEYADLHERAARIAATLQREAPESDPPLTAVFAHRTSTAFAGVLGTLMRGHGYVPLNRTLPVARTRTMFERAECQAVVADAESAKQLPELLDDAPYPVVVLVPEMKDVAELRAALAAHVVLGAGDLEPASSWRPVGVDPSSIAYLLFTSGSTGTPKGVMVSHSNVVHYVDAMVDRYDIDEHDRVSQTHDLTFDVSVFDLFVTWDRGACVCCPGQRTMLNPGRYVRDARLSVWFSVPSVAMFMRRLGSLKPDSYPDLRWSLFAGEPLPVEVVRAWERAAPASIVENLYGPTEATVVCALYSWDPLTSPDECERGLLPIGRPLENLGMLIVDEQLHEVRPGEQGELLVSGPQVTLGYWRDAEKTAAAFVVPPGREVVHYRTGDLVRRPSRADGPIAFMGRRDQQVKIRGVRIELGEIESALRDASGVDAVAALGWPTTLVGADAVEAFVGSDDVDVVAIRAALAKRLPVHMVPRRVRALGQMPLNANGKIDRAALVKLLEGE